MKKSQQETVRDNEKQRERGTVRNTTRDRDTHTERVKKERKRANVIGCIC